MEAVIITGSELNQQTTRALHAEEGQPVLVWNRERDPMLLIALPAFERLIDSPEDIEQLIKSLRELQQQ